MSFLFDGEYRWAYLSVKKLLSLLAEVRETKKDEMDKIGDIFDDPEQLAKFYIAPDCQQFNPADDEDDAANVVREPIIRRLKTFFTGSAPNVPKGRNQLFVLSDAGVGKTSLLVMLKLIDLVSFWPNGYECILLKLSKETISEINGITSKRQKVLLLDALDEDPLAFGCVNKRIQEILHATQNFRRVVITCRTQFFSAGENLFNKRGVVEVNGFHCPVIYISLFTEAQVAEFLKRRFKNDKDTIEKARVILEKMGSLKFRPMLLAHIDYFLDASLDYWNEYTVYKVLIQAWLDREKTKCEEKYNIGLSQEDLWFVCIELACYLEKNKQREISEQELNTIMDSMPLLKNIPRMEIKGRSLLNKNSYGCYRFSHYSIQEFLVIYGFLIGYIDLEETNIKPTLLMNTFIINWLKHCNRDKSIVPNLRPFNFAGANLIGADLSCLNLSLLTFELANLSKAMITKCNLQNTNFKGADLCGANFSMSILDETDFTDSIYDDETIWPVGFHPDGARKI